jgi:flagellar hook protein FlgE
MLRSLNSGVSGLKAFQTKLDVIGNNIANVNTVGYKKNQIVFQDLFSQTLKGANAPTTSLGGFGGTNPMQVGLGTQVSNIKNVFTPGSPMSTYNQSDLYIDGDGFFVVGNSPGTDRFLTRAGDFTLDSQNKLVNSNGMYVMGTNNQPIDLTGYTSFNILPDGSITGLNSAGAPLMGFKIGTVVVNNPNGLQKEGESLYSLTPNANSTTDITTLLTNGSKAQIISGVLEMSNVDISEEMTDMIVAQRGFQANSKIITVSDSILEEVINLKR